MRIGAAGDEARAGRSFRNVVVLLVIKRLDFLRARLDRCRLDVATGGGLKGFDQADVIEEKLVAAGRSELTALLEEAADLRSGPVVVIGQDFDDERNLVRGVSFVDDVIHYQLVVTDTGPFFDGS